MQVLANELCPVFAARNQVASGIVFLEGQVHETVTLWRSLYKEARVFAHCPQEFFHLALYIGVIFLPSLPLDPRPFLSQFSINLLLGSNAGGFVLMQPEGNPAKQAR